jgi:putative hydrolase of the HAD superfamily
VPVRAVIFDVGGVILTSPFEAFARYESDNGLPSGLLRRLNATDRDTNAWARLERNEVDLAGFAELFEAEAAAAGYRVDARAVLELLAGQRRRSRRRHRRAGGGGRLPAALRHRPHASVVCHRAMAR